MYTCVPMYPGPVSIHSESLKAMALDYPPARYSADYLNAYNTVCNTIKELVQTKNDLILGTGEAMLGLWGGLKSALKPNDSVLTIGTGVFGDGFADMALSIGCQVHKLSFPYDITLNDSHLEQVAKAIDKVKPKMITVVHCETPSGTLNPLKKLGQLKQDMNVPLLLVDAVASMGGVPIAMDDWHIDILLGGSQKCFSCPPDITIVALSEKAWEVIHEIKYQGYDALLPFYKTHTDTMLYPYTPNASGVYAMYASTQAIMAEGMANVFTRHEEIAKMCREGIQKIGLTLYPAPEAVNSPTVTAINFPKGLDWQSKHLELRDNGVFLGGSIGPLAGKVFRLGHMGVQANAILMQRALEVLARVF